ncbi:tetratricopeptide repeat protein [Saccharopolyspora erythraea]|uniref:ATP-binding protein n=1 Tax=Saccharopolyspora erythraea TaxID=1836 RepID=UPI001BAB3072|nr:LuxR C-terminal-related transcriptional regulator [Saccharopolyspora erythraea]QUH00779.1 tetratricopeptide repeat protein [Saccharopolyspora erythraea]
MVSTAQARVREPAGNLPVDVTSFVGRRREITLTKRLLAESRVVTITGPGGVGKTRLALRVAGNMRRSFRDKVWCVGLEDVLDPRLLTDAVIDQLGLGGPSSGDDIDTVVEHLKNREMLLVLDNCEQIVDAVAGLVDSVIRWCPGVRVLATSRQSLGVAGESTLSLTPLQVPDIDNLPPADAYEQFASVRLFVDRAKAAVPEFEVDEHNAASLMRLCYHLDGNPLAIELAAVRLRSLSPQQLEERLAERYDLLSEGRRGAPARQQSLRALIDWSYELASDQDKLAWARVSAFSGSFDLDAAEFVAGGAELDRLDVVGVMHSLVDKSILIREEDGGEVRFRLLHALREYGQEKLAGSGEFEEVRRRHLRWYDRMIEHFAMEWVGPEQVAWVNRLTSEQSNLRTAMKSALAQPPEHGTALRVTRNMAIFWGIRGLAGEARYWLDQALKASPQPSRERVSALRSTAWFALLQGDHDAARPPLEEALSLAGEYAGPIERSYLQQTRGMAEFFDGRLGRAGELFRESLDGFQEHNVPGGELFALFGLGLTRGLSGDHTLGLDLLERCVRLSTDLGELFWRSHALWAMAHVEVSRGEVNHAEEVAKEALRLQRRLSNRLATAFTLDTLAWTAGIQGRHERAARLFGAASAMWEALRAAPAYYSTFEIGHDEHVSRVREALGDRDFQEAFDRGYEMPPAAAHDFALESKKHARAATARRDNVHPMPLTRREREIAELVAQGRTNKEIAEGLVIAQRTVEGHVQNILTKLDFTSRAQIAGWIAGQKQSGPADTGT